MQSEMTVKVRIPTSRYADEFLGLKCAPDLLALGFFPNFKEITESFAAYNAVRKHLWRRGFPPHEPCLLLAVGDGVWPRTGATFAFRSKWRCVSIDPKLRTSGSVSGVERLMTIPVGIEYVLELGIFRDRPERGILVAVHSHASLRLAEGLLRHEFPRDPRAVVAIPCCVPQELDRPPNLEYEDWGIWSPRRTVKVWWDS